jgi:four helix bundle protein
MDKIELKKRSQKFAVDVIKFIETLPNSRSLNVLSNQLIRCATSVDANYRSAFRGKSTADFINKIVIIEEEADESIYWFDLMEESGLVQSSKIISLKKEADELTAIFTAIGKNLQLSVKQPSKISK